MGCNERTIRGKDNCMLFKATLITKKNLQDIARINNGQVPSEHVDNPTMFVWPFDHVGDPETVSLEDFMAKYEVDMTVDNIFYCKKK